MADHAGSLPTLIYYLVLFIAALVSIAKQHTKGKKQQEENPLGSVSAFVFCVCVITYSPPTKAPFF